MPRRSHSTTSAAAGIGEPHARVELRLGQHRRAVTEGVRPGPDEAERAQAGGVQHLERVEIRVDALGAFDMRQDSDASLFYGAANGGGVGADRQVGRQLAGEPAHPGEHGQREADRALLWHGGEVRRVAGVEIVPALDSGGREHGEEPAGKPAAPRPLQVDVQPLRARCEVMGLAAPGTQLELQQRVVVAVEDRHEVRHQGILHIAAERRWARDRPASSARSHAAAMGAPTAPSIRLSPGRTMSKATGTEPTARPSADRWTRV